MPRRHSPSIVVVLEEGIPTVTQLFAKSTPSPLIAPARCTLVLLAPTRKDLSAIGRRSRGSIRRNFLRSQSAAGIVGVPVFLYSPCPQAAKHGFAAEFAGQPHREFAAEPSRSPWQHKPFRDALSEQDRPILVLAGFWLEHQVVATALHALADSYDVYFVLDASPAKMHAAVRLSQDRLIQAGATPVVTSQVIHEWSLEAADVTKATALNALLLSSTTSDVG
jgi:hypothetical protein